MDFFALLSLAALKFPVVGTVLMGLGALVVIGLAYVAISPTKNDDNFVAKLEAIPVVGQLLKALVAFSPIQRKEK